MVIAQKSHTVNPVEEAAKELGPLGPPMVKLFRALLVEASGNATVDNDAPQTVAELQKHYPITDGWAKTNVAAAGRGPRQRRLYKPSDVRKALESNPAPMRVKRCVAAPGDDPLEAMIRSGALVRGSR